MATIPHGKKLDKRRILETLAYEKRVKEWGALSRTADRYSISIETVRRYVKEAEAPPPPLDDDLVYVPCPGEKPIAPREGLHKLSRIRPKCHEKHHSRFLKVQGLRKPVCASFSQVKEVSHDEIVTFHNSTFTPPISLHADFIAHRRYRPPDKGWWAAFMQYDYRNILLGFILSIVVLFLAYGMRH